MTERLFQHFTYDDVNESFKTLLSPFKEQSHAIQKGYCELIDSGTTYMKDIAEVEMFMRLLWGASPYYKENDYDDFFFDIVHGIAEGADPESDYYWKDLFSYSQMLVEVASLSIFMIEHAEIMKSTLSEKQFENISVWMDQMNDCEFHPNNWIFFRVLSNMSLKLVFDIDRRDQIESDLTTLDAMYLGEGWYMDGRETQRDYYISFAFHYYSLLYAVFFEAEDPVRSKLFKDRAVKFAKSFQHMFDEVGRAIPYGRSLTYRFAQSSFWSMMLWAEIDEYPLENSKYFVQNNLKNWFQQDFMTPRYEISLGYYYHTMAALEEYNAYGSPYWAFKTFRFLSLPKDAKIYTINAEYPKDNDDTYFNEKMSMLVQHTATGARTYPFNQQVYHHMNGKAKYEKFVYSTEFGFNASKGPYGMQELCFDNVFALSERDEFYRTPDHTTLVEANKNYIIKAYQPFLDVSVSTVLVPLKDWHIRIHYVKTGRVLRFMDCGFSSSHQINNTREFQIKDDYVSVHDKYLQSAVYTTQGIGVPQVSETLTNCNLLHNRVRVPYILGDIEIGEQLICNKFYGGPIDDNLEIPEVVIDDHSIVIKHRETNLTIDLEIIK